MGFGLGLVGLRVCGVDAVGLWILCSVDLVFVFDWFSTLWVCVLGGVAFCLVCQVACLCGFDLWFMLCV